MSKEEKPWISIYEVHGDPEGTIRGNTLGLELLKEKISLKGNGTSIGDVAPEAKKEWVQIKEGKHPKYTQGKMTKSSTKKNKSGKMNKNALVVNLVTMPAPTIQHAPPAFLEHFQIKILASRAKSVKLGKSVQVVKTSVMNVRPGITPTLIFPVVSHVRLEST